MPRRVVIFCHTYFPYVGGAEIAVRELTARMPGYRFDLIAARLDPTLPAEETIGAVHVHRVGSGSRRDKYRYPWLASREARRLHAQQPFALAWGILGSWGGWAALKFVERTPGVAYLLTEQSGDSEWFIRRRTWFWRWRYRQIYSRADAVQVISQYLARRVRRYGYRGEPVVIPNGVDLARFVRPLTTEVAAIRQRVGIPADSVVVVSASRLVAKNGLRDLIAAIAVLHQRFGQQVHLLLAGGGPLEARLQAQASELGVRQLVHLVGRIDHTQLPAYLAAGDIFVRPSHSEGLGNAFLEAMAMGLPVVGTGVGGIVDFLADGKTGTMVQAKNPSDLAIKLEHLITEPVLRQQLAETGQQLVRERYDWSSLANRMRTLFDELTAKNT